MTGSQVPGGSYTITVDMDALSIDGVASPGGDALAAPRVTIVVHWTLSSASWPGCARFWNPGYKITPY